MTPKPLAPCADPKCAHDFYQHADDGWHCMELMCFCSSFQFAAPKKRGRPLLRLIDGGKK